MVLLIYTANINYNIVIYIFINFYLITMSLALSYRALINNYKLNKKENKTKV